MLALVLAVTLAQSGPVLGEAKVGEALLLDVRVVEKGEPAPEAGVWLSGPSAIHQAQRIRSLEHQRDDWKAKAEAQPQGSSWIWGFAAGVLLGGGGLILLRR